MPTKKKTPTEVASSGEVARANALTPKRKKEIAKAGATARWASKLPGTPKGLKMPTRAPDDGLVKVDLGHGEGKIGIAVETSGQIQNIVMGKYNAWRVFGLLAYALHIPLPANVKKAIKLSE